MPRYEHWLTGGGKPYFPDRVICLECTGHMQAINSSGTTEVEVLDNWYAATLKGREGCYKKVKSVAGGDCQSFWNAILHWVSTTGLTYAYSWRAMRNAALLNCFQLIEKGLLVLKGKDVGRLSSGRNRWETAHGGYFVSLDPPTIILIGMPDKPGTLVWMDTRNFGVDRTTVPDDAAAWSSQLAMWVKDMSQAMRARKLGGWKQTAASTAMSSWKYCGKKHSVLAHTHGTALKLERSAYYGGRCEAFRIGDIQGPVYHMDVKSMYPYLCYTHNLPARLVGCWKTPARAGRQLQRDSQCVIADVTLRTDEAIFPVRHEGQTIWPIGTFRTSLCGPELDVAEQEQAVVEYHSIAAYEPDPILKDWMGQWHQLRTAAEQSNNRLMVAMCKAVMNCLPGKMGQREMMWQDANAVLADTPWCSWYEPTDNGQAVRYRALDWRVQKEVETGIHPEAILAASAYVTSLGRRFLMDEMRRAGRENVYYCDTDSLFVNRQGYLALTYGGASAVTQWGDWQIKGLYDSLIVLGVKHYVADGEITCSGCPSLQQSQGPSADTVWICGGVMGALRQGHQPLPIRRLHHWTRQPHYTLGRVNASGVVSPHIIGG